MIKTQELHKLTYWNILNSWFGLFIFYMKSITSYIETLHHNRLKLIKWVILNWLLFPVGYNVTIRMEILSITHCQKTQPEAITVMTPESIKNNSNSHKMDGTTLGITLQLKFHLNPNRVITSLLITTP